MFFKGERLGKFKILDTIGTGGFAAVFLAEDTWIKKKVALKVPHEQDCDLEILLQEPRLLASLNHPNIVNVLTAGKENGIFYIVMEYVDGPSLSQVIKQKGALPIPFALDLARQVCLGLAHAHNEKIIHRDLRPSNVLLNEDNVVKIADFGISRLLDRTRYARTKIGSPPYMAPEHLKGKAIFESDIYSLGVMMYEMMTGDLPFYDPNPTVIEKMIISGKYRTPREIIPNFPPEVERLILKAMARDSRRRYASAVEVHDQILDILGSESYVYLPEPEPSTPIPMRTPRRSSVCWNCGKPLARFSDKCNYCGEEQ